MTVKGINGGRSPVAAADLFSGAGGNEGLADLSCLGMESGVGGSPLLCLGATVPGVCGKPPVRTRGVPFMAFRGGGKQRGKLFEL